MIEIKERKGLRSLSQFVARKPCWICVIGEIISWNEMEEKKNQIPNIDFPSVFQVVIVVRDGER